MIPYPKQDDYLIICYNCKSSPETGQQEEMKRFTAGKIDERLVKNSEDMSDQTFIDKIADLETIEKPETQQQEQKYAEIAICKVIGVNMVVLNAFQVRNPLFNYTVVSKNEEPTSQ